MIAFFVNEEEARTVKRIFERYVYEGDGCLAIAKELNQSAKSALERPLPIATTTHKDVTDRLVHINPALASKARIVLDINKSERHIRGGLATKEKYQHRLQMCSKKED